MDNFTQILFTVHHTFLAFIWSIAFTQINSSTPENADVSAGINSFANKLYEIIAKKNDNLIFSPFSAHSILALTSQGAGNKTTPVLQQVLGIPNANTTAATYKDILGILQTVTNVNIRVANKIYVKSGYKVQQNFQSVARNYFYADVDTVDFSQRQETVDNVNTWVKKQTDNRITELVSVNDFNDLTRALLISAVYFKGNWLRQFKTKHTVTDKFYTSESETVDCRMMKQFGKFYYAIDDELDAQVLEMKYQDERFSMIIVLPKTKTGIGKLEDRLIGKDISTITTFRKSVAVTLPRFKIESNLALKEPLQQVSNSSSFENTL